MAGADSVGGAASAAFPAPDAQGAPTEWGRGRFRYSELPACSGAPSATVHKGVPYFSDADFSGEACWGVKPLDRLGRARGAYVLVGPGTVHDRSERPSNAGLPEPSGWRDARYPELSPSNLYDHSHVAAWALTGIFGDPGDLITATTTLNRSGMAPYENRVLRYVKSGMGAGNERHVLYRVTPRFEGSELVARGLLIEMTSLEDRGASLHDCAWCYNVRPGVEIDYATGESRLASSAAAGGGKASSNSAGIGKAALTAGVGMPALPGGIASGLKALGALAGEVARAVCADETPASLVGGGPAGPFVADPETAEFHRPGCGLACGGRAVAASAARGALILAGYRPCEECRP